MHMYANAPTPGARVCHLSHKSVADSMTSVYVDG